MRSISTGRSRDNVRPVIALFAAVAALALVEGSAVARFDGDELLKERASPQLSWRTATTEHFELHYPDILGDLAATLAETAERAHAKVTAALGFSPEGRTHLVLSARSDQMQVFTVVSPERAIYLDASLPNWAMGLNDYASLHEFLLTHEYTHVLHMDRRRGPYRWLSSVFGAWMRPNLATPMWLKEGLAVWAETRLSPRGRGGSSTYRMMLRVAHQEGALRAGRFVAPDTAATFDNKSWPWVLRPYLFGHSLVQTLLDGQEDRAGEIIGDMSADLPADVDRIARAAGFASFQQVWEQMLERTEHEAAAELADLARTPQTPLEYLTTGGYFHYGLALSPDRRWLAVTWDRPDEPNAVLRFELRGTGWSGPTTVAQRSTGYQSSFSRSGRFLAFDDTARARRDFLMSDIVLHDLESKTAVSLSPYLRARDPDIHPDGKHVVFVANGEGKNWLVETDTAWENTTVLLPAMGFRRLTGPRYAPDGKRVVVGVHNDDTGGEDLWITGPAGPEVLVADGASNLAPSFTPDGRWLLYSSDRTGVSNIYALDLETRAVHRLTHVVGGLFFPVADPEAGWIYVTSYTGRGYDVARFRWDPATWVAVETQPVTSTTVAAAAPPPAPRPIASRSYSASSFLAPQYAFPRLVLRRTGSQLGASVGAVDPLGIQKYEIDALYDTATRSPVGGVQFFDGHFASAIEATVTRDAVPLPASTDPQAAAQGTTLRTVTAAAGLSIPLAADRIFPRLRPGLLFQSMSRTDNDLHAGVHVGLRYDSRFAEMGLAFPEYGRLADFDVRQLFGLNAGAGNMTALSLALESHHAIGPRRQALHLRLEGGMFLAGTGSDSARFYAGGRDSFPLSLASPFLLYGYPPLSIAATRLAVGGALYTISLADIERGLGTAPIFLGRLSGGLRVQAAARDPGLGTIPWSAGAELHLGLVAGHVIDVRTSLGFYRGAPAAGGENQIVFTLATGAM